MAKNVVHYIILRHEEDEFRFYYFETYAGALAARKFGEKIAKLARHGFAIELMDGGWKWLR